MAILIFHSVRPTDEIMTIYSKSNVLKKSSFKIIMHMLNIMGRHRQIMNGYFSVNNWNNIYF